MNTLTSFAQPADTGYKAVVDFRPAVGVLGVFGGRNQCLILDFQVISSQKFWILKTMGRVIANAYGDVYIYAGIKIPELKPFKIFQVPDYFLPENKKSPLIIRTSMHR